MSTSTLANLVVSLSADIAHFSTGMQRAASETTATMNTIKSAASVAGAALGGLASAFTVGAAVDWAKGVVAGAAALDDLADSTGSTVENLSKLANQAKISGVGFDTMATLVNRMAAGMGGADEQTTKVKSALAALGVAAKDPAEAVFEAAKKLDQYADGANKAALAAQIFGKQGPGFLAMLKDMAKGTEAVTTVTTQQAAEAEKLEQQLRKLTAQGSIFATSLLSDVVPALNRTLSAFQVARAAGLGFWDAITAPNTAETATARLELWQKRLAEAQEKLAYAEKFKGPGFANQIREEVAALEAKVAAYRKLAAAANPEMDIRMNADRRVPVDKPQAPTIPGLGNVKTAKQAIADYADEIQKLQDEMAKLAGSDGGYSHLIAANQKYQADLRVGKAQNLEQVRAYMQAAVAADNQATATKDLADGWEMAKKQVAEMIDYQNKLAEELAKTVAEIEHQNVALQFEHDTLGLTDDQRQIRIANLKLEAALTRGNSTEIEALRKQVELLNQKAADNSLLQMAEQARQALEAATAFASDFFLDLFNNGSKAFKNLWENFKQLAFRALADIAAKQVVLSITGAVGLGAAGSAGASTGGIGNLLSGASSAAGGISSIFGASGFTAGLAGDAFLPGALAGGLSGAGIGAALTPVMAALPWAGLAAIAIPLIGKLFGGDGKASRTATFASGDLGNDKSRDAVFSGSSAFGQFGIAKDFWLGPEAGASFKPTLDAITTLDNTIAKMVGGDLTKQITDALSQHQITVGLGKEGTDINKSGGPGQILKDRYVTVLNAIDAGLGEMVEKFQGTGEELASFVVGLVGLQTTLDDAAGGFDKFTESLDKQNTALEAFRSQGEALDRLLESFDGSASATSALTGATQGYYQSLIALISQIHEVKAAVDGMFQDTRESIFLAGRDQQFVYDFLKQQADDLAATLSSLSDPAEIQSVASQINDNINRAFGLLDDAGKNSKRDEFLSGIDNINAAVAQRLQEVQGNATSAAQSDLAQVKELLLGKQAKDQEIADKNAAAVDKFVDGVEQLVTTPIQIAVENGYSAVGGP